MRIDGRAFIFGAMFATGFWLFAYHIHDGSFVHEFIRAIPNVKPNTTGSKSNGSKTMIEKLGLGGVFGNDVKPKEIKKYGNTFWTKDMNTKIDYDQKEIQKFENGYSNLDDPALLNFIRQRWLVYPTKKPNISSEPEKHYSQEKQSEYVDNYLKKQKNGFFVECGAADGVGLSNTMFFEKFRAWRGLLVEANPQMYQNLKRSRPGSYSVNACLSTSNKTMKVKFNPEGFLGQISTSNNGLQVQCFPLFSLLQAIGVNTIDFFSLDVEGSEMGILETIPWDKIRINVLTIEYLVRSPKWRFHNSTAKLQALRDYFKKLKVYKELATLSNLDIVLARKDMAN